MGEEAGTAIEHIRGVGRPVFEKSEGLPMSGASDRILVLTNDDGIDAPGLSALCRATRGLGRCRVVAPFGPYSGCGHVV